METYLYVSLLAAKKVKASELLSRLFKECKNGHLAGKSALKNYCTIETTILNPLSCAETEFQQPHSIDATKGSSGCLTQVYQVVARHQSWLDAKISWRPNRRCTRTSQSSPALRNGAVGSCNFTASYWSTRFDQLTNGHVHQIRLTTYIPLRGKMR